MYDDRLSQDDEQNYMPMELKPGVVVHLNSKGAHSS